MVTPLGILFFALAAIFVWTRTGYVRLMAVGGGLPIGVALVIGGQPTPVFYTLAIGVCVALVVRVILERPDRSRLEQRRHRPGALALVLFTAWAVFITALAPTIFAGIPVLISRGGIDEQLLDPGTLDYTVSNLAQVGYLLIGVGTVFFLARSPAATPGLLGITLGVVTVLSFWRLLSIQFGLPFPAGFFDNSTAVRIIESTSSGEARFRGIFSEPSGLAAVSLTAMVYFSMRLKHLTRSQRWIAVAILVMAVANAGFSTAGTFVASGLILLAALAIAAVSGFVMRRAKVSPFVVAASFVGLAGAVFFIPIVIDIINGVISEKVASSSYGSRTGVDLFSYRLTLETWGLGVGLGSNRPSSFLAMLLSCVGIPGTVLFAATMFQLMRAAWVKPEYRATVWALISVLISKVLAGPNLSDPSALLWITAGVLAHASWYSDRGPSAVPGLDRRPLNVNAGR